jgi:hypothetical protein
MSAVETSAGPGLDTVASGLASNSRGRSRPDQVFRAVLRVPERPPDDSVQAAHSAFGRSMTISALRCTFTYLVFPIVLPLIGLGVGVAPAIGIAIGVSAIVCDVFAIRRFFAADHRWRWQFTALILGVLALLTVLLVDDISQLT